MSQADRTTLLYMKGAISEMSKEEQEKVAEIAERLRNIVMAEKPLGFIAYALVGAEIQAEST